MKILVIVDMQKDFVTGPLGTPEAQAIVQNVKARTESGEFDGIFYTKDTHHDDYMNTLEGKKLPIPHCIENTKGWEIIPELKDNGMVIRKPTFGSDLLINHILWIAHSCAIEEIEFCGVCTDICVVSNVIMTRAALPNTRIVVRANCCAGTTPEAHEAALKVMESCQIDIIR